MLVPPLACVSNIEIWAYGVAGPAPSGDGIKDDFYGGRSHLSELQIASRLSFNSIRLGLEKIFCFLQLPISFSISAIDGAPTFRISGAISVSVSVLGVEDAYVNEIVVFAFGFHNTHSFPS
jgi:hypothetical protein